MTWCLHGEAPRSFLSERPSHMCTLAASNSRRLTDSLLTTVRLEHSSHASSEQS